MADKIATRAAYGEFLVEEGARNPDLIVMDADLSGSTKTKDFAKKYPDRFFNAGIAEQNLMGMATGIALSGKTVCASTFAMFASGRAFEIIRNSIGYTGANVKVCATHAGITVGEDGASHQTFEDLALMRTIPGMTVVSPCDAASAKILLKQVVDMKGPAYVRLGRAGVPVFYDGDAELTLGKGNQLREGRDVTVIANGIMVASAMDAASQLAEEGIDVRVIDMHTIKPLDTDIIRKAAEETGKIVTAEEHSVIGGLGSAVAEFTSRECPVKIAMVGQQDVYGESGKPDELRDKYGMTARDIVAAVRALY
ncbi:transketolase family protein [Hornefia butyriciproducens]|jgi:transketolase|uniref:Transketolase family protein n=1 Tax=Hornefia butyriciproducens TaxID=2652293 RepID=A0A6L5Y275_9FIRM|nr:transketolase family protein [Hornefia butyriciproducens]MCI7327813.1 transketolase family protein [Clostridiales bacterium]MCI7413487.1 transketolase family protein [Clostridiales bacterium]MCI7678977.1 transketolase family protein [Clostridiales bacterium]MDD6298529.1 transketolase family protein [Hornefia butyriciproducens]MDD7019152.1 transketolase family protein [Hornefia butyriciproducens]